MFSQCKLNTSVFVIHILLFQLYFQDSQESCTDQMSGLDPSKVAVMCTDDIVHGTNVFIDTSLASNTFLDNGKVCTCSVQADVGKVMTVKTLFSGTPNSECGSVIPYTLTDSSTIFNNVSCTSQAAFNVTSKVISVDFLKVQPPYDSDYCIDFDLVYCNDTDFQCDNGDCIPDSSRCDTFPDCDDGSDEDCGATCAEGQLACDNGQCISPAQFCDGKPDCTDESDENNCENSTVIQTTSAPVGPLITIQCFYSELKTTTTLTEVTTPTTQTVPETTSNTQTVPVTTRTTPTTPVTTRTTQTVPVTTSTTQTVPETTSSRQSTLEPSIPVTSENTTKTSTDDDNSKPVDIGLVIGVIVAVLVIIVVVASAVCLIRKDKRSSVV